MHRGLRVLAIVAATRAQLASLEAGRPEALRPAAPAASSPAVDWETRLARFKSSTSDDALQRIRAATELLERRKNAASSLAAALPPAEEEEEADRAGLDALPWRPAPAAAPEARGRAVVSRDVSFFFDEGCLNLNT